MLHGSDLATYDFDFCYQHTWDNCERIIRALSPFRPKLRVAKVDADLPFRMDAATLMNGMNFTFKTDVGDVDLLAHVEPFGEFPEVQRNAETYDLGGIRVRVIGLDDLIRIKQHIKRPKDQLALMHLLAVKRVREEDADASQREA